ncbi:MAG: hypothetical protein HBSAPP03_07810 [Phycisphaerae bacterium]|nr:MAG: hypothetical protein HBSAPP03_07810 [Phycisphaerae bacterium]
MTTKTCVLAAALFMTAGAAAQLITPPPPAKPDTPAPTQPAAEQPPAKVPDANQEKPPTTPPPTFDPSKAIPVQPKQPNPADLRPKLADLPDLPYTSLVQRDEHGEVILLKEPVELAALRVNPTLPDNYPSHLTDYLEDRRLIFRRLAINNLDLLELVEEGFIENADYGKVDGIRKVVQTLSPLDVPFAPARLTDDLQTKGMIDPTQAQFNMKIASEYHTAVFRSAKPPAGTPADSPRAKNLIAKTMRRFAVQESEFAYKAILCEAAGRLATLTDGVDLPDEIKAQAKAAAASYRDGMSEAEKIALWHAAMKGTTVLQRRAVLQHLVDSVPH